MPEQQLPPFPDVATPASRATVTPPFEVIVERARQRRRRNLLGVAAVTAAVLAAVATGTALNGGHERTAPQPAKRSQGPSSTATPVEVDAARIILGGGLVSYAAGPDGSLLTVWRKCTDESDDASCHAAWQLHTAGDTFQGLVRGAVPRVYNAGDSYVVQSSTARTQGIVIDHVGQIRPLSTAEDGVVAAGDALVSTRSGLAVVDPSTALVWPLPPIDGSERWANGMVSSSGVVWAMPDLGLNRVWVSWKTSTASAWQHHVVSQASADGSTTGDITVAGDHVAAFSSYDGVDVPSIGTLSVSADAGTTWTDLPRDELPFDSIDAMAATATGTLYVVMGGGGALFRSVDASWTHFTRIPNPQHIDRLESAGDEVLGVGGTFEQPRLFALDDAGQSTPVSLDR